MVCDKREWENTLPNYQDQITGLLNYRHKNTGSHKRYGRTQIVLREHMSFYWETPEIPRDTSGDSGLWVRTLEIGGTRERQIVVELG